MNVCAADTAVSDLDVYIGLFPGFRLEFAPDHLPVDGVLIVAEPALEFVVAHIGTQVQGVEDSFLKMKGESLV